MYWGLNVKVLVQVVSMLIFCYDVLANVIVLQILAEKNIGETDG